MALRWLTGICVLPLVATYGCLPAETGDQPSAELGIAARLGYERLEELRRTTAPEYREAKRQLARAERAVKRIRKKAGDEASERLDELLAAYDRMLDLAYAGRWGEATEVVAGNPRFDHGNLLNIALELGAPVDVVVDLVKLNGGTLPDDAITTIALHSRNVVGWSGAVELAGTLLQNHGLDVHYVDQDGHNALTIAAGYFYDLPSWEANRDSLELIDFLLAHSVTTKPTPGGLDALDRILLGILDTPRQKVDAGIEFLRHLIDRGAPVELSHREVAQMISVSDTGAHARLIEAVPELLE